jgi:hypothetical protein
MTQWMHYIASALAAWIGLLALCFQSSHQRGRWQLGKQSRQMRCVYLLVGTGSLAISYLAITQADGIGFGTLFYISQIGLLGLLMIVLLATARKAALVFTVFVTLGAIVSIAPRVFLP